MIDTTPFYSSDKAFADDGNGEMNLQYDTFLPGKASLEEAFGYKFAKSYSFTGVEFALSVCFCNSFF